LKDAAMAKTEETPALELKPGTTMSAEVPAKPAGETIKFEFKVTGDGKAEKKEPKSRGLQAFRNL
jgi:hypothetical protein